MPIPPIDASTWAYERNNREQIDVDERITSFMDEAKILTPDISIIESKRCMGCDIMQFDMLKCIGCGTCVKNCPNKAISFVSWEKDYLFGTRTIRKARVDPKLCECCGICLSECPVNAISSANWGDQSYFDEIENLANKS